MTTSPEPARAPLLLAELCYFDIPRDAWARALLRARQLGVNTISTPVHWRWHAPTSDLLDLSGISDPRRDLVGFVRLCDRLKISLILSFGAVVGANVFDTDIPAWLVPEPFAKYASQSTLATQLDTEYLAAARRWVAACSSALLPHQSPPGSIAALHVGEDTQLRTWLLDEGWTVPIGAGPPGDIEIAGFPTAWQHKLAYRARQLAASRPIPRPTNRSAPPMLRSDGSARPSFWHTKSTYMLIGAAGHDFAAARAPADLALLEDAYVQPLARRLADAGITFDKLNPGETAPAQLARYALAIATCALAELPGMRAKLAGCANLALFGDRPGTLASALQLADDTSADAVGALIEARGGSARYAWADSMAIEVSVRYGSEHTFLFIHNRQAAAYNGLLAYRAPSGDVLHMHIGIGAGRSGIVMLLEDEVVGAAIDGDGAEGGWLARGLTSSMVFNAGAGGVVSCGRGLLLIASQSGRFQIRRGAGWPEMQAYRLLLSGELIPARAQVDGAHMLVAYTAEDDCGQTDMYIALPDRGELPGDLRAYLAAPQLARALALESAVEIANQIAPEAAPRLRDAASTLAASAARIATIEDYTTAWREADQLVEATLTAIENANRTPMLAGTANTLSHILRLIAGETL